MIARRLPVAALALAALLAACAPSGAPRETGQLPGTITYRERIALPPSARIEIQILDVTEPDAEPRLVAEKLLDAPGPIPIAFSIGYDLRAIDPNHIYALRVRIHVGEDLWFASPFDLRVLTGGNPTRVEALLDRISAGAVGKRGLHAIDPDPPDLDPRLRAIREEARQIDARLDRFDMREIAEGKTQLRLWMTDDAPVKLEVADSGPMLHPTSYYFRDGRLFWLRAPNAGYAFESGQLLLRTDGKLVPQSDPGSGAGVLRDLASRLALFGL